MPFGKLEKFDNSIDKELSILFIQETKLLGKILHFFQGSAAFLLWNSSASGSDG